MSSQTLYINTIDECVNNIIDTYYLDIVDNKKFKSNISDEKYILNNFTNITDSMKKIISSSIKSFKINEIINDKIEFDKILNLLENYLLLYFFFYLGTIVDLNKIINLLNKLNDKYENNFFKNRYLAQYTIYFKYINDYHLVLSKSDKFGINKSNKKNNNIDNNLINQYSDIMISINNIDSNVILHITSKDNKQDLTHNIIKIIIFREIYIQEDKLMLFKILESTELSHAEYKYIDIIDTKYDTIDYASIESLFNIKEIKMGIAEEVFQMINDYEISKFKIDYNIETKINHLFKKKILIPITDEFLRYHKDSEIYESGSSSSSTKIDPKEKVNKKDNTKIRYIVTKINKVKDYYSPKVMANNNLRIEIEKNFYQPMMYRKAIIINDLEEINILRKLELQGKSVTDTNEFYEDLKHIRLYPYIEFKFTNKDSFSFSPETTIDAIRYSNFEYKNDPKFTNILKNDLEYRVINLGTKANIVGVAIPRFNLLNTNNNTQYNQTIIPCHQIKDTMDMSLLHRNAFAVTIKKLRKLFYEDKRYGKLLYWLFNKKNDNIKLDFFDNIKELPKDDYIKLLLGKVYDEMVNVTYDLAVRNIDSYTNIDISTAKQILRELEAKLVLIPRQSIKYAELMKLIYYVKSETKIDQNDINEDKVSDIDTLIKLPRIVLEKIALHIIIISKKELTHIHDDDTDMYEGYLCQHTITWNNLMKYKRFNPNKFNQMLFDFIKKYITENKDSDFVCKSCYQLVDLRKYTTEIYPGSDSISISYGLETELETIPDYVKYTKSIKNIDKIIEKICYSSNISYFVGSAQQTKFRRQEVIKNIIDIVDIQHKTLYVKETEKRKERVDKAIKKYGCSLTNFFLFKLENDIFTYSSKETDKFKLFKMNNILTYVLIEIINELNLSQILYLSFDKLVNYFLFTKFGFNLFDNLYIRISNKNDVAPIKNYKLLCYIIYYLTGMYAKFNMWFSENIVFKPNNINPQIQRIAIHTFVDALNSILDVNTRETKHYLYSIYATKFFNKLNSTYSNIVSKDIIDRLDLVNKKKVTVTIDKKLKYNLNVVNAIPLIEYNDNGKYMIESTLGTRNIIAHYPSIKFVKDKLKEQSQNELFGEKKLKEITEGLIYDSLLKIATLYDENGNKRNILLSIDEAKKISLNSLKKISEMAKNIRLKNEEKNFKKIEKKIEKIETKKLRNEEYLDNIKKQFNIKINDIIMNFVKKLESLIGKDININNNNYYLFHDIYEINHDYRGNKKQSFFISEKDGKIKFKRDEQFFKQDVYYYEDPSNQVVVYYSAIEKYLIGYKENSKDFIKITNSDCYIKIHYSFINQFKLFGFNYYNYNIGKKMVDNNAFINNILRIRLQNLKNALSDIQQIIYQVKNNFKGANLNPIAKYYQTKIKEINTYNSDGDRIFMDWNVINSSLYYENIHLETQINVKKLQNTSQYIQSFNLLNFNTNDHIILYYIIQQFEMLLDVNNDNYIKVNLAYLIINIVFQLSRNLTNCENAFYDINVKKFYHYIVNKAEVSETHDEVDVSSMSEEELEKYKEEKDIDRERIEALDADQDETNEDFGDEDILLIDRSSGEY